MEELSLDQIKKKSDLEKDIDFERSEFEINNKTMVPLLAVKPPVCGFIVFFIIDLLRIPPGFKSGIDFTDKGEIRPFLTFIFNQMLYS